MGFIAGLLVTCSIIPQLIRTFRTKDASGISLLFTVLLWTGIGFWIVYGISLGLAQVIVWNVVGIALVSILIIMKIVYGRRKTR